ncbi:nicotinate-nucleotide adenylyltransferase [Vogesella indigofera]|uniref:nicotinate-nucleotide adenylyltransferase n=1 Tax=Vogesella indigofera TaxID=45465 RepID=UPI00234F4363|nr:nicotinate-nucleotide adenylyltransferase [Vogesella indigofera]MDC7698915.1 nicotinate-nucleotide adenylyltransferase [Vogesella indigofera]
MATSPAEHPPRIGVFGGTFDPLHAAHLRLARAFRDELALDQVRLIPAGQPYHRDRAPHASAAQRLAMLDAALAEEAPGLVSDDREVRRPRHAYTVDTLQELRDELGDKAELWFLIGGDSLQQLHTWQRWPQLLQLANLAVALRPGFVAARLDPAVATLWQARQVSDFSNRTPSGTIRALDLPPITLSATDIRQQLAAGQDCSALLPAAVLAYIRQHRLYR